MGILGRAKSTERPRRGWEPGSFQRAALVPCKSGFPTMLIGGEFLFQIEGIHAYTYMYMYMYMHMYMYMYMYMHMYMYMYMYVYVYVYVCVCLLYYTIVYYSILYY